MLRTRFLVIQHMVLICSWKV